jgi:hypothetical protein
MRQDESDSTPRQVWKVLTLVCMVADPQHARPGSRLTSGTHLTANAALPAFSSPTFAGSQSPSFASPQQLSQSPSLGQGSHVTNASIISMQLGSESPRGAESAQSRDLPDDDSSHSALQSPTVPALSIPARESSAKLRSRKQGKNKKQRSNAALAPSVASVGTERSVEEIMDSAFMGGF